MTRPAAVVRPTPRLVLGIPPALLCVLLGLASGRPEFAAVAAGPLLLVLLGVAGRAPCPPPVRVTLSEARAVEGDELVVEIRIDAPDAPVDVTVSLDIPDGLTVSPGRHLSLRMTPDRPAVVRLTCRCRHWGAFEVSVATVRAASWGFESRVTPRAGPRLLVLPAPDRLAAMAAPRRPGRAPGRHRARSRGPGVEFADLRPSVGGDRPRDINWRASARRGDLWTNERHPDRSGDVVLLVDSMRDAGGTSAATLDAAVRSAAGVAEVVLRARDRVGYVGVGGGIRWLLPAGGLRQWYRLAEHLIAEQPAAGHPGPGLRLLPRAALPPDALVVALTPLLDPRIVDAITTLAAPGRDVLVVEINPAEFVSAPDDPAWALARRLWTLERLAVRRALARIGVVVVRWSPEDGVAEAIEDAIRIRRHPGVAAVGR